MTATTGCTLQQLIDTFPALPATVTSVLAVTADPESTAEDLMQAIISDQAMCATILKVANSAFFGIPREVSTIERAAVVLGFAEIQNIVISKAIFASFPKLNKDAKEEVGQFWNHAFTCGLAAKIIAAHHRLNASEFFVAGLLHDIGKLSMLMAFPDTYQIKRWVDEEVEEDYLQKERESYGMDHCQAGAKIAKRWMLPGQLAAGASLHHAPEQESDYSRHGLILHLANLLAHGLTDPLIPSPEIQAAMVAKVPELAPYWEKENLELSPDLITKWSEDLKLNRQDDQAILEILSGG